MRLIDADKLKETLSDFNYNADSMAQKIVDTQPTIEPEVRHGEMIEGRYPNENKCSECGQIFRDDIRFIYPYDENGVCKTPKRCPECGAFWDGDTE